MSHRRRRRRVPSTSGYDSDASEASASSAITTTTVATDGSHRTDTSNGSNYSNGSNLSDSSDGSDTSANSASTVVATLSSLHVDAASATASTGADALADNLATLGINGTPGPSTPDAQAPIPNTHKTRDISNNANTPTPNDPSSPTPTDNALSADLASLTLDISHSGADSESDSGGSAASNADTTIMSVSDAQETLDSFFNNHPFKNTENNRLRLWLAMCIEFGLVDHPEATTHGLPPLPTSTTKASKLLHEHAHVNLVDYRDARRERAAAGREPVWGEFKHLVFSSPATMAQYTRGKIVAEREAREEAHRLGMPMPKVLRSKVYPLEQAKEEMLNPLLRDIFRLPRR